MNEILVFIYLSLSRDYFPYKSFFFYVLDDFAFLDKFQYKYFLSDEKSFGLFITLYRRK